MLAAGRMDYCLVMMQGGAIKVSGRARERERERERAKERERGRTNLLNLQYERFVKQRASNVQRQKNDKRLHLK